MPFLNLKPAADPSPETNTRSRAATDYAGGQIIIALVADRSWSTDAAAAQLIRWGYSILWLTLFQLPTSEPSLRRATLILTNRSRWEIERMLRGAHHPPIITSDDFDLGLRGRIEAYLKSRALSRRAESPGEE
jgi:hypothetical protein